MKKIALLFISVIVLSACLPKEAKNRQATHDVCYQLWNSFDDNMRKAYKSKGTDKIYYTQIAQMNLSAVLARGCCEYADTCPAAIDE